MRRRKFVTVPVLLMCAAAPAQDSVVVLASTSWVAALALAAGADPVGVIASAGRVHRTGYGPIPTDLLAGKIQALLWHTHPSTTGSD